MYVPDLLGSDLLLYRVIHSRLRARRLDQIMVRLTSSGTKGAIWLLIASILVIIPVPHGRQSAVLLVAALLIAQGASNLVLKPLFRRQRPYEKHADVTLLVRAPGPNSWPSGHAASSMAAAVILAVMYPFWSPAAILLAVGIAYSRVYVGVHYPADVLSGAVIGTMCAALVLIASHVAAITVW